MKMNVRHVSADTQKKMARVLAALEKQPKKLNMDFWGISVNYRDIPEVLKAMEENPNVHARKTSAVLRAIQRAKPPCGTVACLAGQTLITLGGLKFKRLTGNKLNRLSDKLFKPSNEVFLGLSDEQTKGLLQLTDNKFFRLSEKTPETAAAILGLSDEQATMLFYPVEWPDHLYDELHRYIPGTKKYLNTVKKRWKHMIEEGL
jgi:hypothetical protein